MLKKIKQKLNNMKDEVERHKDLLLIKRSQNGDNNAFDELINKHYSILKYTAMKILKNKHNAEDAVQNAIVYAWKSIGNFRFTKKGTALGWLNKLVTGKSIDMIRTLTSKSYPIYDDLSEDDRYYLDTTNIPTDILMRKEVEQPIKKMMFSIIGDMTPIRKTTAFLYFILNETPEEIASKLDVNIKTVQKRIERTRHQLKSRLVKQYGNNEIIEELL